MRSILIDIYKTKDLNSGLGQFSLQLAQAILANPIADQRITFLQPRGFRHKVLQGCSVVEDSLILRYLPQLSRRFDLWHSTHQLPSHRPARGTPWILTIHDLNFLVEKPAPKAARYLAALQRDVDRADALTAISHFTKAEIEARIDLRGKAVRVIPNGVALPSYADTTLPAALTLRPFFLAIGVLKEKKNLDVLLPLLSHFPDHALVIAGNDRTAYGDFIRQHVVEMGLSDRVHMTGPVDDRMRFALYTHCAALLMPSVAEGFGMPVVEALSLGKPVFASRRTSLPEVGGDAARYFDDFAPNAMAKVISDGLRDWNDDAARLARQHAHGYSWPHCVKAYQELYAELLSR